MKEYYRIGEVSALHHIEISKLRYYDQINLFKPMNVDPKSGYRSYHVSQFPILSQILMFRDLGIPLGWVAGFLLTIGYYKSGRWKKIFDTHSKESKDKGVVGKGA